MDNLYFETQWPKDNLFISIYVHDILSNRYHWHESEYEINLILQGKAEFCHGAQLHLLGEDDLILIEPNQVHSSFSFESNTVALVLRFSAHAFRPFLKAGEIFTFSNCVSTAKTQNNAAYCRLRFYLAQILQSLHDKTPYSPLMAKGSMELLVATLCSMFDPQAIAVPSQMDNLQQETIRRIAGYIENNYKSKVTLEDLADFLQYNRTYVSTFFKNNVGINFHEYLTRVRFQHALGELTSTQKSLTEIATSNGFPDLKTFTARFRATLQRTPAEYRAQLTPGRTALVYNQRNYRAVSEPAIQNKLQEYMRLVLV